MFLLTIAEREQFDPEGGEDHNSFGICLSNLAYIHFRAGRFADALRYLPRAAAELTLGKRSGRVDQMGLARAFARASQCHASLKQPAEAIAALQRAVEEGRKGDMSDKASQKLVDDWARQLKRLRSPLKNRSWSR